MILTEYLPTQIRFTPENARRAYVGIRSLADSIDKHGLLEPPGGRLVAGVPVLSFGNRRLKAVLLLVDEGKWPLDRPVPFILREESDYEEDLAGIIENVQRDDVPMWQTGAKMLRIMERENLNQEAMAKAISKRAGYVSMACTIARGLHPDMVKRLDAALPDVPPQAVLLAMASRTNLDTLEPDFEAQLRVWNQAQVNKSAWGSRRRKTGVSQKKIVVQRFNRLKEFSASTPDHAAPYLEAILNYLSGASLKLRWPREQ